MFMRLAESLGEAKPDSNPNFEFPSAKGIEYEDLSRKRLITPVWGLGTKTMRIIIRVLELTRGT